MTRTARPRKPSDPGWDEMQHRRAERLTRLTRGVVEVQFYPTTFMDDDHGSEGHLFFVGSRIEGRDDDAFDFHGIWLDSRRPLAEQLRDELYAKAEVLRGYGDQVAGRAKLKGGAT